MDRFVPQNDELGRLLNEKAGELYNKMKQLDVNSLPLPYHCLAYFNGSHFLRLFFSIETSARLLYRSIKLSGKSPSDLSLMDYGAGVGTLYLLAKMIGCRMVIYNDHLDDWRLSAELIAEAINIKIDHYIVADIGECLKQLSELQIQCDVITSRNVIEHIYRLDIFYDFIHLMQPTAIIVSSTTANKQNSASVARHLYLHRKWEKVFKGMRRVTITRQFPDMPKDKVEHLAAATRGLATDDLQNAIKTYAETGRTPLIDRLGTNTCNPANGVWAEHLITFSHYRTLINESHYNVSFAPGFWDTHYKNKLMNFAARLLNKLIAKGSATAFRVAPFIYVIAIPVK